MSAEKWVPSTEDLRGILREYYLGHDHFDAWLAARDRAVKAGALREAAEEMRRVKEPYHWNLPVAEESWASPDVWLERRAYEVKRGER